jgi:hypothetical protein
MRKDTFNMRLTAEEAARFARVARAHDLPIASMLRILVKREELALGLGPTSSKEKRK